MTFQAAADSSLSPCHARRTQPKVIKNIEIIVMIISSVVSRKEEIYQVCLQTIIIAIDDNIDQVLEKHLHGCPSTSP